MKDLRTVAFAFMFAAYPSCGRRLGIVQIDPGTLKGASLDDCRLTPSDAGTPPPEVTEAEIRCEWAKTLAETPRQDLNGASHGATVGNADGVVSSR
jgi:hypothetical protein